ncbi:MAG: FprA family A-type flavoprotein [Thermoleophilia bacterium]
MAATEIKPDIYWVGAIDWAIRDFHGYITPHGTTYNNYLILDEEITLVDSVKQGFTDESLRSISELTDPAAIRNIVVNHVENDHASGLEHFVRLAPEARVHVTERGRQVLERFFDISGWNINVVKTGDELKCGRYTLQFIETPMLHWPDSMMTYVPEAELLISQDAFGQHLATAARFDDEFIDCESRSALDEAVIDYYANILMPFGGLIKTKIEELVKLGLPISMIAPDHGIIWRRDPGHVMQAYLDMATGKADLSVSIIYDTMWHSTEIMAGPLMQGIRAEGVDCRVIRLRATPTSVAITEFWKSRGCLIGSPTLNNGIFPSVAQFMTHLKGLRPKNRIAGAFGSFGWAGGAVKLLYEELAAMKLEVVEPGVAFRYKPSSEDLRECFDFGRSFVRQVKDYHQQYE